MSELSKQTSIDQALRELPLQQAPDDCWQQIAGRLDQQASIKPRQRGSYRGAIAASVAAIGLVVVLWPGAKPAIQGGGGFQEAQRFDESLALMSRSTYSTDQALEEIAMLNWIQEIDENRHYGDLRQQVSLRRQRDQLSTQLLESTIRVPDKGVWL
ncbi:hypothetical protein QSV34_14405 [Porticoccus sp. W117]|uniref:hypothetical protein n=1 Tax=Porticoccus sp. W117 TaxID=3054777 RepID=UPI002592286C|nr:hypothetical protein [Porticoccus sp. W117]MDM3872541.1 hypothetical protein [Porticoccus sp. W117]